jgi:WS/DGAT/MGAT family acyltransferase
VSTRERRRLSPLDAAFLYYERPEQRLHVGCLAILDGSPSFPAFAAAIEERLRPIRRYRQRPVRPLLDLDWPRWEDDREFDVRRHLRHVAVPAPGGDAELHELVDTLFASPLDPAHPLWETYLIDGLAGGRAALLCKAHHAMIDGVSGAQLLEVMADAKGNPAPTAGAVGRTPPSTRGPSTLRSLLQTATSPAALLGRVRDAIEAGSTLATLLREPASPLPFNGRLTDARHIVWASFALDNFLAIRGAQGCKVNDVVLAVIAGGLRRYVEGRGVRAEGLRVRTLVPVSVRGTEDHLALGNLVTSMFPTLPVGVADPVERLRRMAEEMRTLKERGQARASGLTLALLGRVPPPLSALLGRLMPDTSVINTVCTNVPGPRETCHILGCRIVDVHPIVPLFQRMGMEFAILSYAGRLSIAAAVDPHLAPDADLIPGYLEASVAELRAALPAPPARGAGPVPAGPLVGDLMTAHVVTLTETQSLGVGWELMRAGRIRHLPVVDRGGRLVGLVTHRDLLAAAPSALLYPHEQERVRQLALVRAADVMETHLAVAAASDPAVHAAERMIRHKIGCLPVVGPDGRLAGIVTEEDFLRWAMAHMAPVEAARRSA